MKESSLPNKITKEILTDLYEKKKRSVSQISKIFLCSENKINYWLAKYGIKKRSISDAMYQFKNPSGDPFLIQGPKTLEEGILFGLGLGLYWGEGSKRGNGGIRLTNTDPKLVRKFIKFLEKFCNIDKNKIRFSIQIFDDISPKKALDHWMRELGAKKEQFYKIVISKVRGSGTYKYKSEFGVVILHFNNIKLKKIICEMIEKTR